VEEENRKLMLAAIQKAAKEDPSPNTRAAGKNLLFLTQKGWFKVVFDCMFGFFKRQQFTHHLGFTPCSNAVKPKNISKLKTVNPSKTEIRYFGFHS